TLCRCLQPGKLRPRERGLPELCCCESVQPSWLVTCHSPIERAGALAPSSPSSLRTSSYVSLSTDRWKEAGWCRPQLKCSEPSADARGIRTSQDLGAGRIRVRRTVDPVRSRDVGRRRSRHQTSSPEIGRAHV